MTTVPPLTTLLEERLPAGAPGFLCPSCQCLLEYVGSRETNGRHKPDDLSDYYTCPAGCGVYERDRWTHRLRGLQSR